jgi:hypothetical protein
VQATSKNNDALTAEASQEPLPTLTQYQYSAPTADTTTETLDSVATAKQPKRPATLISTESHPAAVVAAAVSTTPAAEVKVPSTAAASSKATVGSSAQVPRAAPHAIAKKVRTDDYGDEEEYEVVTLPASTSSKLAGSDIFDDIPSLQCLHNENWQSMKATQSLGVSLHDFGFHAEANNVLVMKLFVPIDSYAWALNISPQMHMNYQNVLMHFNPRYQGKRKQIVFNDKQGTWGGYVPTSIEGLLEVCADYEILYYIIFYYILLYSIIIYQTTINFMNITIIKLLTNKNIFIFHNSTLSHTPI